MRLADFILENREAIMKEWDLFAGSLLPAGGSMNTAACRDHVEEILVAIVHDMNSFQSESEQAEKSKGRGEEQRLGGAGHIHAALRIERGFKLDQLVAEYRALRASVLRLWKEQEGDGDIEGLIRFNEAIDEALTAAASRYMETMDRYRDQFLGILGHDLRNPLGAILMGASTLTKATPRSDKTGRIVSRILSSARRMDRLVGDLLDLTRTRLGPGIPIHPAPIDLGPVCRDVVAELKQYHPREALHFAPRGDLRGEWDGDRIAQVVSNLVGNAMQHGAKEGAVTLVARDDGDDVVLEVHNEGPPIPRDAVSTLFEPMIRHAPANDLASPNLGLGLYIAEQVVTAHGGTIDVTSTEVDGTTFVVHLPRHPSPPHFGA